MNPSMPCIGLHFKWILHRVALPGIEAGTLGKGGHESEAYMTATAEGLAGVAKCPPSSARCRQAPPRRVGSYP